MSGAGGLSAGQGREPWAANPCEAQTAAGRKLVRGANRCEPKLVRCSNGSACCYGDYELEASTTTKRDFRTVKRCGSMATRPTRSAGAQLPMRSNQYGSCLCYRYYVKIQSTQSAGRGVRTGPQRGLPWQLAACQLAALYKCWICFGMNAPRRLNTKTEACQCRQRPEWKVCRVLINNRKINHPRSTTKQQVLGADRSPTGS